MGQQTSTPPPPPETYTFKTDTDFDTFSIPEKLKPEFDDQIVDHKEKIFSIVFTTHARAAAKTPELKLRQFDEHVPTEEGALSETEYMFSNMLTVQEVIGGNYECVKDWKGIDLFTKQFSALERRKLVKDLKSCGTSSDITDPVLRHDFDAIQDYRNLVLEKGSLKQLKSFYNILKSEEFKHLEDTTNNTYSGQFTEQERNQLDEIVKVLKLEKTLDRAVGYGDNIAQLPPSFLILGFQQMGLHCRNHVLNCIKANNKANTTEESIDMATIQDYQTCLSETPCFFKLGVWLTEKIEAAKVKK